MRVATVQPSPDDTSGAWRTRHRFGRVGGRLGAAGLLVAVAALAGCSGSHGSDGAAPVTTTVPAGFSGGPGLTIAASTTTTADQTVKASMKERCEALEGIVVTPVALLDAPASPRASARDHLRRYRIIGGLAPAEHRSEWNEALSIRELQLSDPAAVTEVQGNVADQIEATAQTFGRAYFRQNCKASGLTWECDRPGAVARHDIEGFQTLSAAVDFMNGQPTPIDVLDRAGGVVLVSSAVRDMTYERGSSVSRIDRFERTASGWRLARTTACDVDNILQEESEFDPSMVKNGLPVWEQVGVDFDDHDGTGVYTYDEDGDQVRASDCLGDESIAAEFQEISDWCQRHGFGG